MVQVNPLPFDVVRKVVEDELLGGLPLEEVRFWGRPRRNVTPGASEISLRKITRKMMPYLLEASDMLHGFLGKTSFFSVFMLQVQGYPRNEPRSLSESTVQEVFPSP